MPRIREVRDIEKLEVGRLHCIYLFFICLRLLKEEGDLIEYCKKLVLSCLHNVTSKWMPGETQPDQGKDQKNSILQVLQDRWLQKKEKIAKRIVGILC